MNIFVKEQIDLTRAEKRALDTVNRFAGNLSVNATTKENRLLGENLYQASEALLKICSSEEVPKTVKAETLYCILGNYTTDEPISQDMLISIFERARKEEENDA